MRHARRGPTCRRSPRASRPVEPLDDRVGDRRADALGAGEVLRATPRGSRPSSRTPGPAPGPRSGRRGGSTARPAPATAGRPWRLPRLSSSRWPLADSTGPSPSPFFGARVNSGALQQLRLVEVEHVALVLDHPRVEQRDRRLVAQPLDVEGAAPGDVEDALPHLGRAELVVGAAQVLVALLLLRERRAAGRALRRHHPLPPAPWGAAAAPGRRSRGSRRPPCAGSPCRRVGRPCA